MFDGVEIIENAVIRFAVIFWGYSSIGGLITNGSPAHHWLSFYKTWADPSTGSRTLIVRSIACLLMPSGSFLRKYWIYHSAASEEIKRLATM
jgi:hypothetical protein